MGTQGRNQQSTLRKFAWLGAFFVVASCAGAHAQPEAGPRQRKRQREGERSVQADGTRQRPRGFQPRSGTGGPEAQRPGGRPRFWNDLPEQERKQVERFMEEHFPRLYVEMQRMKDRDEVRYARRMTRIAPQMRKIMETVRTDPQRGTLMIRERLTEFEIQQTIADLRGAKDEEAKRQLREHLDSLVGKAFDCQNERRQLEVRDLEARLSELESRLSETEKMREALIRERVTKLLEQPSPPPDGESGDDRDLRPDEPEAGPE